MTMRAAMRQPSPHALPSSRVAQLAIGAQFARLRAVLLCVLVGIEESKDADGDG